MSALGFYPVKLSVRTGQGRFPLIEKTLAVKDKRPLLRIGGIHHPGLRSPFTQRLSTNQPSYFETAVIRPRHLSDLHRGFISLSVFLSLSLSLSTFLSLYLCIFGSADLPSI
ncbi:MAG: hypothetical protein CMQ03_04675 [Gammaproteobacteria bacterium]|nr:hypothetical protein [Gammaproteobacteria bacterium]